MAEGLPARGRLHGDVRPPPTARAHVVLRGPDGAEHELVPGDVVGRLWTAALPVPDGRVSEAHALVSLREGQLLLLPLRGALAVGGELVHHVVLAAGLRVALAQGVEIVVVSVHLPDAVLALRGAHGPAEALAAVTSLVDGRLVKGWRDDAAAWVWTTGDAWLVRTGRDEPRPLAAGESLTVAGARWEVVELPLTRAGPEATRQRGEVTPALELLAWFDSVHLRRQGEGVVVLSGRAARLVSELVAMPGPVPWRTLAGQLWPDEHDDVLLRGRLDVVLSRLRRTLRAHGVREDLVRTDGTGMVELVLYPQDRVEDHT